MSDKELMPCPQCGGQIRNTQKTHRLCIECEMDLPFDHNEWWYVKEIARLKEELAITDKLLSSRETAYRELPCPTHGPTCVPGTLEEINRLKAENAKQRDLINEFVERSRRVTGLILGTGKE